MFTPTLGHEAVFAELLITILQFMRTFFDVCGFGARG